MEGFGAKQDYQKVLRESISVLWRQKLWIFIPVVAGILISIGLIFFLPKRYRSTTLILVEAQKVPEEYVKSAVTGTLEGRLSTIKQQILSRSLLQRIIDKFDLYVAERKINRPLEEIVEGMRNNIEVRTVGSRGVDAFSVSYTGSDPVMVMNVTNELASLFIEENLKIREQFIEGTTEFLDSELRSLKETLEQQESQIGEFKRTYMGELPGQLEANLRSLDRFQADLASIQLAKKAAQDRKTDLEKSIEIAKKQRNEIARINEEMEDLFQESNLPSVGRAPSGPAAPLAPTPLMLKLEGKRNELANLLLEYKETYPDAIALKREIRELEKQVAQADAEMNAKSRQGSDQVVVQEKTKINRTKVGNSELADLETEYLRDLQKQIGGVKQELESLKKQEEDLRDQVQVYQKRVENAPAREQELVILQRDYENTRKNYATLLDKKLNAKISENLEKKQKGEQFRILDPANLPEKPFKPEPIKIGLGGLVLGLVGGLALAFIREQLDGSIRKMEEVERITSVPVLVSIPDFKEEIKESGRFNKVGVEGGAGGKGDHV